MNQQDHQLIFVRELEDGTILSIDTEDESNGLRTDYLN